MRGEKQMNRKEKKAVGLLKALNNLEKKCKIEKVPYKSEIKKIRISLLPEDYGIFEILLNLIEKLQKENEELKEYIAIAPNLDEMTATKYRNIQQDAYIQGRAEEKQRAKQIIYENYIPVQKVKDKIEELNRKINNGGKTYGRYGGCVINSENIMKLQNQIEALKELLEGRK